MSHHYTSIVEKPEIELFVDNQDIFAVFVFSPTLYFRREFCSTECALLFQIYNVLLSGLEEFLIQGFDTKASDL